MSNNLPEDLISIPLAAKTTGLHAVTIYRYMKERGKRETLLTEYKGDGDHSLISWKELLEVLGPQVCGSLELDAAQPPLPEFNRGPRINARSYEEQYNKFKAEGWLTVADARTSTRISRDHIRSLILSGHVRTQKWGASRLVKVEDLQSPSSRSIKHKGK